MNLLRLCYITGKVQMWYDYVTIAKVQPQAVHAAASRSLQFEWSDLQ